MTDRSALQKLAREKRCEITEVMEMKFADRMEALHGWPREFSEHISQNIVLVFVECFHCQQIYIPYRVLRQTRDRYIYRMSNYIPSLEDITGMHKNSIERIITRMNKKKGSSNV